MNMFGVESEGYTYMGPANNPQPSIYIIPVNVSVVAYRPYACTYHLPGFIPIPGVLVERIVYDVDWRIWVNSNGSMSSYSFGTYITPPGINRNWKLSGSPYPGLQGFYYMRQCQSIW